MEQITHPLRVYSNTLNKNIWIHEIRKSERHNLGLICVNCQHEVIPKLGEIRQHHFAHKANANCHFFSSESELHKDAKLLMQRILMERDVNVTFTRNCSDCHNKVNFYTFTNTGNIDVDIEVTSKTLKNSTTNYEAGFDDLWTCDVAIFRENNLLFIVEIKHTNETKTFRPKPWFEIRAMDIHESLMNDFNSCNNNYIFHDIRNITRCESCRISRVRLKWQNSIRKVIKNNREIFQKFWKSMDQLKERNKDIIKFMTICQKCQNQVNRKSLFDSCICGSSVFQMRRLTYF